MISAVILTHNSDRSLERALDSLSWCDEIIVIDDGSTDRTPVIANKFGTGFVARNLNGDFSRQRNFGLDRAKGEWVLFLDADEIITSELSREIREAVKKNDLAGYYFTRTDHMWGRALRHGETAQIRLLRLAKKNSGRWVRPVHEIWDINGPTGLLTNPIQHYPHPNVAQFLASINWYSSLNASYLASTNAPFFWWHIIAYPFGKFVRNYLWFGGFRDGTPGAVVAIMMSMHSYLTRAKLWQLKNTKR